MSDLGQLLQKARMDKGISLEELQETTKIRKRYLEAIEEGDYKILPGNFYVRAFIKSYAEAVGLEPDEVLALYKNVIPPSNIEQHIEPILRPRRSAANTEKLSKLAFTVLMWSFPVLILAIIYYFINSNYAGGKDEVKDRNPITNKMQAENSHKVNKNDKKRRSDKDGSKKSDSDKQKEKTIDQPAPVPQVTLTKTENGVDIYSATNSDKLSVQVKLTGSKCWYRISQGGRGGKVLEEGTLNKDKAIVALDIPDSAFIHLGLASAVEVTVNGVNVATGTDPNSKKIQIDLVKNQPQV